MKLFTSIFLSLLLPLAVVAQSVQIQDGAILAEFSVSDSTKVYFSQGNLQYQASTGTWRFAEHQWDFVGDSINGNVYENGVKSDNLKISPTYDGWIDLFGWGTSGWNSGANAYQPYSTSRDYRDYFPGGSIFNNLTGSYANADWGMYNKISNGGNQAGQWRTLTYNEWSYLISGRAQANRLMGQGRVNNVNGLILLPDGWETPSSVKFTYAPGYYSKNVYSQDEWAVMQSYGAVFFPAAGERLGAGVDGVGSYGNYWSSSGNYGSDAAYLYFYSYYVYADYDGSSGRYYGRSVRLVQDVKK